MEEKKFKKISLCKSPVTKKKNLVKLFQNHAACEKCDVLSEFSYSAYEDSVRENEQQKKSSAMGEETEKVIFFSLKKGYLVFEVLL